MIYEVKTSKGTYEGNPGQSLEGVIEKIAIHIVASELDTPIIVSIVRVNEDESEHPFSSMAIGYFEDRLELAVADIKRETKEEIAHENSFRYAGKL